MTDAQLTFIQLKYFPRWSGTGCMDAGLHPSLMTPIVNCAECGEHLYETCSLELCIHCGYVDTDYWGLIKHQDILTTRRHRRKVP